jgi:hypothetical protein
MCYAYSGHRTNKGQCQSAASFLPASGAKRVFIFCYHRLCFKVPQNIENLELVKFNTTVTMIKTDMFFISTGIIRA